MSMHENVLRQRRELDQNIREIELVILKTKDPVLMEIEMKDGSAVQLSVRTFGRSSIDHMLQSVLSDLKKELEKIEARISKWE